MIVAFKEWVFAERLLPARQGPALVFSADLPAAGVAAEKGDVAAYFDELLEVVAHRRRPILVVPDAEHELVVREDFGVKLEVFVDGIVELVAGALGPLHEGEF